MLLICQWQPIHVRPEHPWLQRVLHRITYEFGHKCQIVSKVSPAVVASQLADRYSRALFRRDRSNEHTSYQVRFT
jgi:hypothetical protein